MTDIEKMCLKLDLNQLEYQVTQLKTIQETKTVRLMRCTLAKKYVDKIFNQVSKGA